MEESDSSILVHDTHTLHEITMSDTFLFSQPVIRCFCSSVTHTQTAICSFYNYSPLEASFNNTHAHTRFIRYILHVTGTITPELSPLLCLSSAWRKLPPTTIKELCCSSPALRSQLKTPPSKQHGSLSLISLSPCLQPYYSQHCVLF